MGEYGTEGFQFSDPAIRLVSESDAKAVAKLFRLNYGDSYPYKEVFDGTWVKRCVYSDSIVGVVLEEDEKIIGSGAVILDYGDHNDQIGELARLVVDPRRAGRGVGRRIIGALFETAGEHVEFATGVSRTRNLFSQKMVEMAGCTHIGLMPQYYVVDGSWESLVVYAKLTGNGLELRSNEPPQLIPEVVPLARHVLKSMQLPATLSVIDECPAYPDESICSVQRLDRNSLARLARIEHGRLVEPLLFGGISLDQGLSFVRRRNAVYMMALDKNQHPVGALGYQEDKAGRVVKGIEMIAKEHGLRGHLCGSLLRAAESTGARIVEVNVSAYDPRLQRTFYDHGFRPAAYAPAMVFHGTRRLDVVKMLKLNVPYEPGEMKLTDRAREVVDIVKRGFLSNV